MSASRERIDAFVAAARTRLAARAALQGAAAGALVAFFAAVGLLLVASARTAIVSSIAIGAVPAAILWWRERRAPAGATADAIERRTALFRNALIASLEVRAHPERTSPFVAARLEDEAARAAAQVAIDEIVPLGPAAWRVAAAAVPVAALIGLVLARPDVHQLVRSRIDAGSFRSSKTMPTLSIAATVTPPAYAGLARVTLKNPDRIEALDGSRVRIAIETTSAALKIKGDAAPEQMLTRNAAGRFDVELPLRSGYLLFEGDHASDRHLVVTTAVPDRAPVVRVSAPGRDRLYPDAARRVAFSVSATDDLSLRSLRLQYTKVTGSGETFAFTEGEIPLDLARRDPRTWDAKATASLASLGLSPGDTLVYRATAFDARPDGVGVSDAFVIEIGKAAEGLSEGFAIGEDQNKYAISQQMVIVKTERLHAKRGTLPPGDFTTESHAIAAEQRMVRAEFVFMTGGEVEDEEVEAEHSHELAEGRLENRGQSDLRTAIRLMSDAERQLVAANTGAALPVERAALEALERAFSRNRYILRTIAARNRIDLSRRLSGNRSGAASWIRPVAPATEHAPLDPVREIVGKATELSAAAEWTADRMRDAARLGERTIALTSTAPASMPVAPGFSPVLQTAARHFLDASRRRSGTDDLPAARRDLQQAVAALLPLAGGRGSLPAADASPIDPALRGAFADALRGRTPR